MLITNMPPIRATTEKTLERHKTYSVLQDRRETTKDIVEYILTKELNTKKMSPRCVLRMLMLASFGKLPSKQRQPS